MNNETGPLTRSMFKIVERNVVVEGSAFCNVGTCLSFNLWAKTDLVGAFYIQLFFKVRNVDYFGNVVH